MTLSINSAYAKRILALSHKNIKVLRHPDHINEPNKLYAIMWAHHEKLVVIDGSFWLFSCYYAPAAMGNLMVNKDGVPTNAVYGFANRLEREEVVDLFNTIKIFNKYTRRGIRVKNTPYIKRFGKISQANSSAHSFG